MGIDWSSIQEAMDRQAELRALPPDMLATYADDMGQRVLELERLLEATNAERVHYRTRAERAEQRLATAQRTAWVAVAVEWSTVAAGDVIEAKNGTLMLIQGKSRDIDREDAPADLVTWDVDHGPRTLRSNDPDKPVPVLRRPTADALDILSRQLGAQVMK